MSESFPLDNKKEILKTEKQVVLDIIMRHGIDSPEAMQLILDWTKNREGRVQTPNDQIEFEIDRADLYIAAGDVEGAIECLEDALLIIINENSADRDIQETRVLGLIKNLSI